jgi:hypothetical protein
MSHVGGDPSSVDLCGGLSPCDAFDYDRDGNGAPDGLTGVPGFCFLPPTVDNHLSSPACAGAFVPGLNGVFKLAWCRVDYGSPPNGAVPPSIVSCQNPADWKNLVEDAGFYSTSVRWRRNEASEGDIFRLYVVRGSQMFAHRDVVIDPNLTTPADGFLHAIGFGNEPVKVRITESFECVYFDTQGGTPANAATCLVAGATTFPFSTEDVTATFRFPDGNPTFLADFEVSECLSLGFSADGLGGVVGNALVDTPLADCKLSVSSNEVSVLTVPAEVEIQVNDPRWVGPGGAYLNARLNLLRAGAPGVRAMPPTEDPGWEGWGTANPGGFVLRWLDWGFDRLVGLVSPEPLRAVWPSNTYSLHGFSDFQVSVQGRLEHVMPGTSCAVPLASCRQLGGAVAGQAKAVTIHAAAPTRLGSGSIDVPGVRVHVFPETGTVSCPAAPAPGQTCYAPSALDLSTSPPSTWNHLVVITGTNGNAVVDWTPVGGLNRLRVSACGMARPGANEPNPPGEPGPDRVWGELVPGGCSDRAAALTNPTAYDNGPADGFTPFEPVDVLNEVAIYGLPLTFEATTCPQIVIDGRKSDATGTPEWNACATRTGFIAPLKGPNPTSPNAWLYTYNDGNALYLGLEVVNNELGNKIFFNLVESFAAGQGVAAAGDELLIIDFGVPGSSMDWHLTQACVGNNASSLCGAPDALADGPGLGVSGAAVLNGAGSGRAFYEFKRPLGSPNAAAGSSKEDLRAVTGQQLGVRLQVTQGQGGGKGGFVFPDPQTSPLRYHPFTIQ